MSELHEGWRLDPDQAHQDDWAMRILDCPRARCRRTASCQNPGACAGLDKYPFPDEAGEIMVRVVRAAITARRRAIEAGPEADSALGAAWTRDGKRRRRLALRRARAKLGAR